MKSIFLSTAVMLGLAAAPAFADTPGTGTDRDWRVIRTNVNCDNGPVNAAKMQRGSIVYLIEAGAVCEGRTDTVELPVGLHPFERSEVAQGITELFGAVNTSFPARATGGCQIRDSITEVCLESDRIVGDNW